MVFHSIEYFALLTVSAGLYFVLPVTVRWVLMLGVSYLFYSASQASLMWLLLVSSLIDYSCGLAIYKSNHSVVRKGLLALSVSANLSLLAYFKYRLLIGDAIQSVFGFEIHGPSVEFILPIGISFFTLQSMGYTIDVYRNNQVPERNLGYFCLYVAYFPQLIAGPIERARNLIPQLHADHHFDWTRVRTGALLILAGLFKKLVIVGTLSLFMKRTFDMGTRVAPMDALIAFTMSLFYIYADFSAYTDIARGSSRIFGIELMENFHHPMLATSIRDFWQRWHISLPTWIFDYLHKPIASVSSNPVWRYGAVILTFFIVGLWHGANVTFIIFGVCHGILIVAETMIARRRWTWPRGTFWTVLRILRTSFVNCFLCVLFLSPSFDKALSVYGALFSIRLSGLDMAHYHPKWRLFILLLASLGWMAGRRYISKNPGLPEKWNVRWMYYLVLILSIMYLAGPNPDAFIYFRF